MPSLNRAAAHLSLFSSTLLLSSWAAGASPSNIQNFEHVLRDNTSLSSPVYIDTALVQRLLNTSNSNQSLLYSQLSADSYATFTGANLLGQFDLANQALSSARSGMDDGRTQPALWAQSGMGRQRLHDDGNGGPAVNHYRRSSLGGDIPLANGWWIGGGIGSGRDNLDNNARDAKADSHGEGMHLYAGKQLPLSAGSAIRVFAGAGYNKQSITNKRQIHFQTAPEQIKGSYDSRTSQAFAEAAYNIPWRKPGYLEPYLGLSQIHQQNDHIREYGGIAASQISLSDNDVLVSNLGARLKQQFQLAGRKLVIKGDFAWRNLNGDLRPSSIVQLQDRRHLPFEVLGSQLPRNSYLIEVKLDYFLTPNLVLDVDYNASFSNSSEGHFLALKAHWKM